MLCYPVAKAKKIKTLHLFFKQDAVDMLDNISLCKTYLLCTVIPINDLLYITRAKLPTRNPLKFYLKSFKHKTYVSSKRNYLEIFQIVMCSDCSEIVKKDNIFTYFNSNFKIRIYLLKGTVHNCIECALVALIKCSNYIIKKLHLQIMQ